MKVTLINYTTGALELLIFTKGTRLKMSPEGLDDIMVWPMERKLKEIEYMANTIPSSWEFCDYTFMIEDVTRAFTHQLVRTRTASFAQQSHRVTNMSEFDTLEPESIKSDPESHGAWNSRISSIKATYEYLLSRGISIEDARGVLPTNILTNIVMKINMRNFVELVHKRTSPRVQGEYRDVLKAMQAEVMSVHPWMSLFLRRTFDQAAVDLDNEIASIEDSDKKLRMMKLVDQLRAKQ